MKKRLFFLLIIIGLTLPAVWSLLQPGYFPSHDGEWMVIRFTDFHRSFVSGQIPVRWAARLNHGYGYLVLNFLYPLFMYIGEFFYFFTGSFVSSIKLVFIISFFLSGILMYLWAREKWGDWGGLVSALFYIYTPYRFLDVYVRGSVGEALAFVFPPLIFWMTDKLSKKKDKIYVIIGGLAFAGLITAHNTMAMLFTAIWGGYLIFHWWFSQRKKIPWPQLSILLLGLGLACFFWFPALYEKQFVYLQGEIVSDFFTHFPSLPQLLIPSWGYGYSLPHSYQDEISFQIGLANLVVLLVMFFVFMPRLFSSQKLKKIKKNWNIYYFLFVFLISFFLMLEVSTKVWHFLPLYNLIQFPWRLLSLTTFASAFLAGALIQLLKGHSQILLMIVLIVFIIGLNYQYARPGVFSYQDESFYTTNDGTTTVANEYLPVWVKEPPLNRPENKVEIISGKGEIKDLIYNSKKISFLLEAGEEAEVQINTIYYPGWQLKVDNQKTPLTFENEKGVMRFKVTPGEYQVVVSFGETPVRLLADFVSLASIMVIGGLLVKRRKDR